MRWLVFAFLALAFSAIADDGTNYARIVDGDTDRVPEHTVAPEYPRKARRDRVEGEVVVCFDIDRYGRPRRIAVRHSTNRQFEKPSIRAVRASSFRPLKDHETLQAIKTCRTFMFSLIPAEEDESG